MQYISTRGQVEPVGFRQAVLMGLADDGGLLIPEHIPDVSGCIDDWDHLAYPDLAMEVLRRFADDIPETDLKALIDRTYGEAFGGPVAPVAAVGDRWVLELWHGPTLAFKDVALQLLGNLFEYILSERDVAGGFTGAIPAHLNILGATSGDTGSAAICGVRGRDRIDIFMLHPAGRISEIQQRQMTAVLDANVHNVAVEGSFDDCQRIMKTLAADLPFKRAYGLGAVNSVNWARVLAQIVYYFAGAFEVRAATGAETVQVCVPTGNFGNVLAGWYAMRMGAPIRRLILATNENDILARFFNTGAYSLGEVRGTLAPAMDIQVASNFERYLYYRLGEDPAVLRRHMDAFARTGTLTVDAGDGPVDANIVAGPATTDDVLGAIDGVWREHRYVLDPHTACGWSVAQRLCPPQQPGAAGPAEPVLCLATAHPAKFPDAIRQATGENLARHPQIDELMDLPTRCEKLPSDIEAVRAYIQQNAGGTNDGTAAEHEPA